MVAKLLSNGITQFRIYNESKDMRRRNCNILSQKNRTATISKTILPVHKSQRLLIIFGRDRPYSILSWLR